MTSASSIFRPFYVLRYTFYIFLTSSLLATPVAYTYLDITGSSNAQGAYVNTGYLPKYNTNIRAKFRISSNANQALYCSRNAYAENVANKLFNYFPTVDRVIRYDYYGNYYKGTTEAGSALYPYDSDLTLEVVDGVSTLTLDSTGATIDGSKGPGLNSAFGESTYPLVLFASYSMSGNTPSGWGNCFRGRFYYLQVYEPDGDGNEVLAHEYRPCVDGGVTKIIDMVTDDTFAITKVGASTLTVSSEEYHLPIITYTASGYSGRVDALPHSISVSVTYPTEGVAVEYSTDEVNWSSTSPSFTDAGDYTVYYRISADDFDTVSGSSQVTLIPPDSVGGAFKYESTLTVAGYTAAEPLTNFPVLVKISAAKIDGFAYDKCQADGKDIAFTSLNGSQVYPHEIDEWNTDGESLVWVRIPELTANFRFKFKFGNAAMTVAPAYTHNGTVWSGADYFGVYHLNETANAGSLDYLAGDSSPYGMTMTPKKGNSGTLAQIASDASGAIGRARSLNSSAQYSGNALVGRNYDNLHVGDNFTVSGWFKSLSGNGGQIWLARRSTTGDTAGWSVTQGNGNQIYIYGANNTAVSAGAFENYNGKGWFHLTVVYEGGKNISVYYQSATQTNAVAKTLSAAPTDGNAMPLCIGSVYSVNTTAASGSQDEVRIRRGSASRVWAETEYANVTDGGFITATAATEPALADTITVTSSSTCQAGTVSPAFGTSAISAGSVTCTAPAEDIVIDETSRYRYTGWKLTQIPSVGTAVTTIGIGSTCTFTHTTGDTVELEWQMSKCYLVSVEMTDNTRGTVTGTGYLPENSTASLQVVPADGSEFAGWTSSQILSTDAQNNPYAFTVTGPFTATAKLCDLRYRLKVLGSNWKDASSWEDIDGDGVGDIPPNDGTAIVVLPMKDKTYTVTLSGSYSSVDIKGIYLQASPVLNSSDGNAVTISGGTLTIREGGIEMDESQYAAGIKFNCDVVVACSQTWMNKCSNTANSNSVNNDALTFQKKLSAASDVVLTIAGQTPFKPNVTDASEFFGKIRTNCGISFGSTSLLTRGKTGVLEIYEGDTPYRSTRYTVTADKTSSSNLITITQPISLDLASATNLRRFQFQISEGIAGNAWNYDFAAPLSGTFNDKKLSFGNVMSASSQHRSHHPEKQRNWFSGDNSGLVTNGLPAICFPNGVFTIAGPNALGRDNVLGAYLGAGDTEGFFCGVTATNNIKVNSAITLGTTNPMMIGMQDEGEAEFAGSVTGNLKKGQALLTAVPNATVTFSGSFTMNNANNYSLETMGGGTVVLSGDNSQVTQQPLNIRSAKTVLAHANAAGTKAINLGGVVPGKVTVRAVCDRSFAYCEPIINATDAGGKTNYTFTVGKSKETIAPTFDGVTLEIGDLFLYTPDLADGTPGRIFQYAAAGRFGGQFLPYEGGMAVYVEEGTQYGGSAFMLINGATASTSTSCGYANAVRDLADPDVALMLKGGITVANDVNVTDNKSTGTSTIGVADATENTLSGTITLNKDVEFDVAPGGKLKLTGSIVDDGDHNVKLVNSGTVEFPQSFDWSVRTLDLSALDNSVFTDAPRNLVLATGSGLNTASIIPAPSEGRYRVKVTAGKVTASKAGLTFIVR